MYSLDRYLHHIHIKALKTFQLKRSNTHHVRNIRPNSRLCVDQLVQVLYYENNGVYEHNNTRR